MAGPPGVDAGPARHARSREGTMAAIRTAEVSWNGGLADGQGTIDYVTSGAFSRLPVTWASRTEAARRPHQPRGAHRLGARLVLRDVVLGPARSQRDSAGVAEGEGHRDVREARGGLAGRLVGARRPRERPRSRRRHLRPARRGSPRTAARSARRSRATWRSRSRPRSRDSPPVAGRRALPAPCLLRQLQPRRTRSSGRRCDPPGRARPRCVRSPGDPRRGAATPGR